MKFTSIFMALALSSSALMAGELEMQHINMRTDHGAVVTLSKSKQEQVRLSLDTTNNPKPGHSKFKAKMTGLTFDTKGIVSIDETAVATDLYPSQGTYTTESMVVSANEIGTTNVTAYECEGNDSKQISRISINVVE